MEHPVIESVGILGAGAMGAMYAAHFAAAGFEVGLVASAERAARLREQSLTVNGAPLGAGVLDPDAANAQPVDLVLVAVKHQHLGQAIESVAPLVGPDTTFLSVLNGLDSEEIIGARYGTDRVPLCIALAMDAERNGTGVRYRQAGRLTFGDGPATAGPDGPSPRVRAVQQALDRAGLAWETPDDMRHAMWWKFLVNVGINQASAVLRAPYGAFQGDGPARELMLALQHEVMAVAAPEGVRLDDQDLARWDAVLAGQPAQGWTSMHQDVVAGRSTEADIFAGRVVELGRRHGIPTPYNQAMLWILRALGPEDPAPQAGKDSPDSAIARSRSLGRKRSP